MQNQYKIKILIILYLMIGFSPIARSASDSSDCEWAFDVKMAKTEQDAGESNHGIPLIQLDKDANTISFEMGREVKLPPLDEDEQAF